MSSAQANENSAFVPVFYHVGRRMDLSSDVHRGRLELADTRLIIHGTPGVDISYREMTFPTENFRLHFLCRMLRVIHRHGDFFFTVALVSAFGRPIVSNHSRVMELQARIDAAFRTAWLPAAARASANL
ncbi:MAG: hypothetical protein L0Z55_06500 [Planctomycetes bacterium]|nr:hypothetical protein [Planctomycetota bacterium]